MNYIWDNWKPPSLSELTPLEVSHLGSEASIYYTYQFLYNNNSLLDGLEINIIYVGLKFISYFRICRL